MSEPTTNPFPDEYGRVVAYPHPSDPTKTGPTVAFPDSLSHDEFTQAAHTAWEQIKNVGSGLLENLGLPSTVEEVHIANAMLPDQLAHPVRTAGQIGSAVLGSLDQSPLLQKAITAYHSAGKVTPEVIQHFIDYALPFVGPINEQLSQDLQNKDYSRGLGHAAAAILPMLFGGEEAPITSEAEAAKAAARQFKPEPEPGNSTASRLWKEDTGEAIIPGTGSSEPNAPTFYSKAERVANEKVSNNASGDQVLATLRNNGVKESEIEWLALDDYLRGKAKVSKSDLQQYINEHKIELKDVDLGYSDRSRQLAADRDKAFVENNRIWADHLRYANGATELFNAMKEGQDVEPVIAKMAVDTQEPARRFVETDKQLHDLDDELTTLNKDRQPTRYESYTLPGEKSNYAEKLLTLPDEGNLSDLKAQLAKADEERTHYLQTLRPVPGDVELRFQDAQKAVRQAENKSTAFKSSHFDEPNVLAHVRFDDRPSIDGKKTLFLEELQSDWHQKGKREGYQNPAPKTLPDGVYVIPSNGFFQVVNREGNPLLSRTWANEADARNAALEHYGEGAGNPGVPNAPFKNDWHELVMKRMLRHAAENGYDRLAWTTGEQQAERYDLSKQVSRVEYLPEDKMLRAFDPDGHFIFDKEVEPEDIADHVGKEPARKLLESKPQQTGGGKPILSIEGEGLKVGGDWAKALYDRAIPNFLRRYTKRWDAKVGETEVSTTNPGSLRFEILDPKGNVYDAFRNRAGAEEALRGYQEAHHGPGKWIVRDTGTTEKVHSIEITPKMRRSVMKEGQPISKNENAVPLWAGKILAA